MYQLNNPIRIAKREENTIIINIPRAELQVEVNENVEQFILFLQNEKEFDDMIVVRFLKENDITNESDYMDIFKEMKKLKVIKEV